jgi:nicotinamide mononucleotide (NMN) deamidase PncC
LPGASAYFLGGAVVYTQVARRALLDLPDISTLGMRASTEPYALLLARTTRQRFSATWALAESGATGPAGNRYGDAPGHSCIAVAGRTERAITLETGSSDRLGNMHAFTAAALDLLADRLAAGSSGNHSRGKTELTQMDFAVFGILRTDRQCHRE